MSFNSTTFVFFFLTVFAGYWAVSRTPRLRFALLFVASCLFYMSWNPVFIGLILFSTALDYVVGGAIHRASSPARRKALLSVSLAGNLGLLGFFKYANFFAESFYETLALLGLAETGEFIPWGIVLPVGISFYTFQSLSYTIDIYRGQLQPTTSLLKFSLFVSFFPQLVAGPIVRARDFLPQLEEPARYDDGRTARGVFLIALGLIKKVALADTIGMELVDPVFAAPSLFTSLEIWAGVCGALFQFYLDFSAYSDIAIGCAACLGYTLPVNFDRPFLSQDLNEFWRRWHISMTTWFRDYVFITLGGTRGTQLMIFRNVVITLFLTGLWHGAGWNFIIWGEMYAVAMILQGLCLRRPSDEERAARGLPARLWRRALTFNFVALSMLAFRNGTEELGQPGLAGTVDMLGCLFSPSEGGGVIGLFGWIALGAAALIHFTPRGWVDWTRDRWLGTPAPVQAAGLTLLTGTLAAIAYEKAPFIYFQF